MITLALPVLADTGDQSQALALIQITLRGQAVAEKFLATVQAQGGSTEGPGALIGNGDTLLQEAQTAYASGDYATAIANAIQAQAKFREAIIALTTGSSATQTGEIQERMIADAGKGETVMLTIIDSKVAVLQAQIDQIAAKGIPVNDLRAQLSQVQSLIADARLKFATGKTANGVSDIQQAEQLIQAIQQAVASRSS